MRYIVLNVFNGREHKVFESRDREKAIDRAERLHRALKQDYKVVDRVTRNVEYDSSNHTDKEVLKT